MLFLFSMYGTISAFNLQRVYPIDSAVYQQIRALAVANGYSAPSSSGPWSGAELLAMLQQISVDAAGEALYAAIFRTLMTDESDLYRSESFSFGLAPAFTFEGYLHSNPQSDMNDLLSPYGYSDREPMVSVSFETYLYDSFYGITDMILLKRKFDYSNDSYTMPAFSANLFTDAASIENYYPFHALASWGNDYHALSVGRDVLSWGDGQTGNFLIGHEADYYDYVQYTIFGMPFQYTFLMTQFDNHDEYGRGEGVRFGVAPQILIAHRFELQLFDWLRIVWNDASIFDVEGLDIRMFSPFMFIHNYNNFQKDVGQGNNIVSFEVNCTPVSGLNLYLQGVIDQIQFSNEMQGGITEDTLPNAYGVMIGIRNERLLDNGILSLYVEGVYTSPYLYLNTRDTGEYWDYNFTVVNGTSSHNISRFLGYGYGPDAIVVSAGVRYLTDDDSRLYGNVLWMVHGENQLVPFAKVPELQTGPDAFYALTPTGDPEYGLRVECGGEKHLSDWITVGGSMAWVQYYNYLNDTDREEYPRYAGLYDGLIGSDWQDLRVVLSATVHPLSMF